MSTIAFTFLWNVGLATVLAILVGLLSRSKMLQHRPGLTHALWLLVLAKLVTPPVIPVPVLPSLDSAMAGARTELNTATGNNGWRQPSPAEHGSLLASQAVVTDASARAPTWSISWFAIFVGVSGCGTLILVIVSVSQLVRVSRILRRATIDDLHLQGLARRAAARMATQVSPVVCVVDASLAPFLWVRWSGPVIVLPIRLIERMDDEQITCILSHELAHHARRDHWSNAFSFLVAALFWWQPVVWWARHEMRAAQEVCCDGLALATGAATRRCYAETLFQALEFVQTNRPLQPTLVSGFGSSCSLKRRFAMIASPKVNHRLSCWAASFAVICSVAMLCVPVRGQTSGRSNLAGTNTEKKQVANDPAERAAARAEPARDELDARPWYTLLKAPTPEEVEKYFSDLQQKHFAQQIQAQPREPKWPDFQPGPGGKDRFEIGWRGLDPGGQGIVVEFLPKGPIIPLKSYCKPTSFLGADQPKCKVGWPEPSAKVETKGNTLVVKHVLLRSVNAERNTISVTIGAQGAVNGSSLDLGDLSTLLQNQKGKPFVSLGFFVGTADGRIAFIPTHSSQLENLPVAQNAKIVLDGKESKLADLKANSFMTFQLVTDGEKIEVREIHAGK